MNVCFHEAILANMNMSHHLDTPLARQNGQLYIDDLYIFPGKESTVFVMDVNWPVSAILTKRYDVPYN